MMGMIRFYKVLPSFFEIDKVYSFNIYLFDPQREKRVVALYAASPVTAEVMDEWRDIEEKGAYLQLDKNNKTEFFFETETTEAELNAANEFYFRMAKLQEDRIKQYESLANENFLLRTILNDIAKTGDFLPLIKRTKAEIMMWPLYENETVSICTELVDKLFIRDIMPVRVAALSYMIAKQSKITDMQMLCDIVLAALLKDLGYGLIQTKYFENFQELQKQDIYLKHPMLTIYVLSKCGHDFSKTVKRLILEQHEQSDGSGFPREKKEDYIEYVSFIINLSDQILMYSSGKINGRKTDLIKTIELFHKGVPTEGVNVNFPHRLLESLGTFLLNDLESEMEKASKHGL